MLVTIHNLPSNTRYCDVKSLIETKCGLSGVILDNLVNEGNRKKVTIGVVEEEDAAIIVRKINGLYLNGMQLYVEDVRQKKASDQPYRSDVNLLQEAQSKYKQLQQPIGQTTMNLNSTPTMVPPPITNYDTSAMYYMPMGQTPYMNYGQTQPVMSEYSGYPVNPESTLGLGNSNKTNSVWQTSQSNWEQPNSSKRSYNDQQYSDPNINQYDRGQGSGRHDNPSRWTTDNIQRDNTRKRKFSPPRDSWSHQPSDSLWQHKQENPQNQSQTAMNQYNNSYESSSIQSFSGSSAKVFGSHVTESNSREQDNQRASRWDSRDIPRPKERDSSNLGKSNPTYHRDTAPPFKRGPINNFKQSNYCPPAKRFKDDNDRFKGGSSTSYPNDNRAPTYSQNNVKRSIDIKKMFQKDCASRCQAASIITNQILMNRGPKVNRSIPDDVITERLKRTVRSRMHILVGYKVQVNVAHLISLYRGPFTAFDDQNLYEFTLERLARELELGSGGEHSDGTGMNKETRSKQQAVAAASTAPSYMEDGRVKLPKYIEGSKKLSKQQKHFSRMDFVTTNETLVLDPKVETALNEELDIIQKLVLEGCSDPQGDAEQMFCKRFHRLSLLDDMMRIIKVNLSKRMCGERCTPALRIYGHPKPPKKAALEHYLAGRGVLSLKKAEKKPFFIATCDSYDSLDRLCAQEIITICGIETIFKPMYLTGIPPKILKKLEKKNAAKKSLEANAKETEDQSNIEGSDDNGIGESDVHNKPQTEETQVPTDQNTAQNDQEEHGCNNEAQKIEDISDITLVKSCIVKSITDQSIHEENDSIKQVISEENVTQTQKDGNGIEINQNTEDILAKNEESEILENQNPDVKEIKNELKESINTEKQTAIKINDVIEGLVVGPESNGTENGIKDINQNNDEHGEVATVNNNIRNKDTENVSATEYLSTEQKSLNFEDFAVIDEVTGDDVGSDKEGDNVKFASNIEIPDIDQVDEDDLEDY